MNISSSSTYSLIRSTSLSILSEETIPSTSPEYSLQNPATVSSPLADLDSPLSNMSNFSWNSNFTPTDIFFKKPKKTVELKGSYLIDSNASKAEVAEILNFTKKYCKIHQLTDDQIDKVRNSSLLTTSSLRNVYRNAISILEEVRAPIPFPNQNSFPLNRSLLEAEAKKALPFRKYPPKIRQILSELPREKDTLTPLDIDQIIKKTSDVHFKRKIE